MSTRIKKVVVSVTLLTYLITGLLLELAHHQDVVIIPRSIPVLSGHDCGSTEVHTPLDSLHPCFVCTHINLRTSALLGEANILVCPLSPITTVRSEHFDTLDRTSISNKTRSPPRS